MKFSLKQLDGAIQSTPLCERSRFSATSLAVTLSLCAMHYRDIAFTEHAANRIPIGDQLVLHSLPLGRSHDRSLGANLRGIKRSACV